MLKLCRILDMVLVTGDRGCGRTAQWSPQWTTRSGSIAGVAALLTFAGMGFVPALGVASTASTVLAHGRGVATFLRDPREATRSFFRDLTPAQATGYIAGLILERARPPPSGDWSAEVAAGSSGPPTTSSTRQCRHCPSPTPSSVRRSTSTPRITVWIPATPLPARCSATGSSRSTGKLRRSGKGHGTRVAAAVRRTCSSGRARTSS